MSGLRISPPPEQTPAPGQETEYSFKQPCAIPSYLIAIASGEVVYRPFQALDGKGWKTGCWAEVRLNRTQSQSGAHSLARHYRGSFLGVQEGYCQVGTDQRIGIMLMYSFVATAEKLVSDYRFGVYDILFLPDSFPYGGKLSRSERGPS
jgi:leukotriene-A4 hydrolase